MGRLKITIFAIALMIAATVLSGCTSTNSTSPSPGTGGHVVVTVGAPTPVPTEPEPTVSPTWVPSPTPKPPAVTLSDFTATAKINGDQPPISGDPGQQYQLDAQHAVRRDMADFKITNTGDATLKKLGIVYEMSVPMTSTYNGQTFVNYQTQHTTYDIGTLNPGDSRDVEIISPQYSAMSQANVTITAKWDGGSLELYKATLEQTLTSGNTYNPVNTQQLMSYGAARAV